MNPSPWDSIICCNSSQNSGKPSLTFISLLKDMIKGTGGQPGEGVQRVRSGRVPGSGAPVPIELGCVPLTWRVRVHPPGSSPNPILLGFYGASARRPDPSFTPLSAPLSSQEDGVWG